MCSFTLVPVKVQHPHVWVNTGDRSTQGKAGLLTEWRQTPLGEWEGRVVILSGTFHNPGEALSIVWLKAEFLRPAVPNR